jgi:hypothetical protein
LRSFLECRLHPAVLSAAAAQGGLKGNQAYDSPKYAAFDEICTAPATVPAQTSSSA